MKKECFRAIKIKKDITHILLDRMPGCSRHLHGVPLCVGQVANIHVSANELDYFLAFAVESYRLSRSCTHNELIS